MRGNLKTPVKLGEGLDTRKQKAKNLNAFIPPEFSYFSVYLEMRYHCVDLILMLEVFAERSDVMKLVVSLTTLAHAWSLSSIGRALVLHVASDVLRNVLTRGYHLMHLPLDHGAVFAALEEFAKLHLPSGVQKKDVSIGDDPRPSVIAALHHGWGDTNHIYKEAPFNLLHWFRG